MYYKENLRVNLSENSNINFAALWMEVGDGRNKWMICNYYREFKILGQQGSEIIENQKLRIS